MQNRDSQPVDLALYIILEALMNLSGENRSYLEMFKKQVKEYPKGKRSSERMVDVFRLFAGALQNGFDLVADVMLENVPTLCLGEDEFGNNALHLVCLDQPMLNIFVLLLNQLNELDGLSLVKNKNKKGLAPLDLLLTPLLPSKTSSDETLPSNTANFLSLVVTEALGPNRFDQPSGVTFNQVYMATALFRLGADTSVLEGQIKTLLLAVSGPKKNNDPVYALQRLLSLHKRRVRSDQLTKSDIALLFRISEESNDIMQLFKLWSIDDPIAFLLNHPYFVNKLKRVTRLGVSRDLTQWLNKKAVNGLVDLNSVEILKSRVAFWSKNYLPTDRACLERFWIVSQIIPDACLRQFVGSFTANVFHADAKHSAAMLLARFVRSGTVLADYSGPLAVVNVKNFELALVIRHIIDMVMLLARPKNGAEFCVLLSFLHGTHPVWDYLASQSPAVVSAGDLACQIMRIKADGFISEMVRMLLLTNPHQGRIMLTQLWTLPLPPQIYKQVQKDLEQAKRQCEKDAIVQYHPQAC